MGDELDGLRDEGGTAELKKDINSLAVPTNNGGGTTSGTTSRTTEVTTEKA